MSLLKPKFVSLRLSEEDCTQCNPKLFLKSYSTLTFSHPESTLSFPFFQLAFILFFFFYFITNSYYYPLLSSIVNTLLSTFLPFFFSFSSFCHYLRCFSLLLRRTVTHEGKGKDTRGPEKKMRRLLAEELGRETIASSVPRYERYQRLQNVIMRERGAIMISSMKEGYPLCQRGVLVYRRVFPFTDDLAGDLRLPW